MRRLMMAAVAAAGFAGAGLLPQTAQALPVGGASGLGVAGASAIEQVAWVCPRPRWNGFTWVQRPCYQTFPMVAPAPLYVAPPPVIVRRPWRRRVYVY